MDLSEIEIESLLANTSDLIRKMYFIRDASLLRGQDTIATCINYSDLMPMCQEFVNELVATVLRFVYSSERQQEIIRELTEAEGRDVDNAYGILMQRAHGKFRKSALKGQFAELLIFNLLQHHFKAVPLLRKMPITTNPACERNGADAIHIGRKNGTLVLYIGECKTSNQRLSALGYALKEALKDVVRHYENHRNELNLYTFEDFIPPELEQFARDYVNGKVQAEVNLIGLASYRSEHVPNGNCRGEFLASVMTDVRKSLTRLDTNAILDIIPDNLKPRLHLILFPVTEMARVLDAFGRGIGA